MPASTSTHGVTQEVLTPTRVAPPVPRGVNTADLVLPNGDRASVWMRSVVNIVVHSELRFYLFYFSQAGR